MEDKKNSAVLFPGARKFINEILYPFGLISTATLFLMSLFAECTNVYADNKPALTLRNVAVVLAFCFVFALANRILTKKNLSYGIRILLHFITLTADFIATIIIQTLSGLYTLSLQTVKIIAIFVAIYFIIAIPMSIIRHIVIRSKIDNSKYKKQF